MAESDCINMSIICYNAASGTHIAKNITLRINLDLIKADCSHFLCNSVNVSLLCTAFSGNLYKLT